MIPYLRIVITLSLFGILGCATTSPIRINALHSVITFMPPDTSIWKLEELSKPDTNNRGLVRYTRIPFPDQPSDEPRAIMSFAVDYLPSGRSIQEYSSLRRLFNPYRWTTIDSTFPSEGLLKTPLYFTGQGWSSFSPSPLHDKERLHKYIIVYIVHGTIVLEAVCDAPAELFPRVEKDMNKFTNSINVADRILPSSPNADSGDRTIVVIPLDKTDLERFHHEDSIAIATRSPFSPPARLIFTLLARDTVTISVYGVNHRPVSQAFMGILDKGTYQATFSGDDLPPGRYSARFEMGTQVMTRKFTCEE